MSSLPRLHGAAAPLPSPSTDNHSQYFAPLGYQSQHPLLASSMQSMQEALHSSAQLKNASERPGQAQSQRHLSCSSTDSNSSDAWQHLRDFNLIAEAAKRAQVACVTRDFEDVSMQ